MLGVTGEGLFAIILAVKRLFILAGANGSGKSTISKVLLPTEHIVYVNPDDIAKELNPSDPTAMRIEAGKETLRRIAARVQSGGHFVPDEDVRRRYVRSKENFVRVYIPLVNHWMLYYNGGTDIVLAAHGNGMLNVILRERYTAFMEGLCQN